MVDDIKRLNQSIFINGINTILPPRCPINGDIVDKQGMISPYAWLNINFIADPICSSCGIPLGFEVSDNGKCMDCFNNPPIYSSARSALQYDDASKNLILGFKHGDKAHVVSSFIPWMMRAGATMLAEADYTIPVPLHYRRLVARRYNQSALIASALSTKTGITHLPLAMRRIRATPSQGHLSYLDRVSNVSKAFDVTPKYRDKIDGKIIILVDDVYTTGATVNECARILLNYAAERVHVLTLARVINNM